MTEEFTVAGQMAKANKTNSIKIGYTATKDGVILHGREGAILIPTAKMEEMHADMLRVQRVQTRDVRFHGIER